MPQLSVKVYDRKVLTYISDHSDVNLIISLRAPNINSKDAVLLFSRLFSKTTKTDDRKECVRKVYISGVHEEKSRRRYKRVKRADERIQGLAWFMCIYTHFCLRHFFYCSFFSDSDRLFVSTSSAAEPKQRVKGLIHGRRFCVFAVYAFCCLFRRRVGLKRVRERKYEYLWKKMFEKILTTYFCR
jgi:hypothetical protein